MWGGKRSGSGRNKRRAEEKTDWNMYKKEAKAKKLKEAAKSTMDWKKFLLRKRHLRINPQKVIQLRILRRKSTISWMRAKKGMIVKTRKRMR